MTAFAGWIEYALTRIDFHEPANPDDDTPDRSQRGREADAPSSISHLMQTALENPGIVSLAAGFVDQQSLPVDLVGRSVATLMGDRADGRRALQYGTTSGDLELRARLLEFLERSDGQPAGRYREALPRTIVTTGSAQLIYLVCEALLDPGDIVLVESPTYFVFLGPLETRGARAIRIPIDEGGMRIDAPRRDARAFGERGTARAGQADLHDPRARQPDRDQPRRIATAAPGRAGQKMVEDASHFRTGGRCLPRSGVRGNGAAVAVELRPRGRHGDPGSDVQQNARPGAENRLRSVA